MNTNPIKLDVSLGDRSYPIYIARGILTHADRYLKLDRRVLIVTDDGVPAAYAQTVARLCKSPTLVTVKQGEESKSFASLEMLCRKMLKGGFTRGDCVVAVGGGIVGDLAGFAAASYMRGIDFYNIPTTLLSQVDSSIGGKVAVDFGGVKNIVGAFHQPRRVLIDPNVLKTLPSRQLSNGMAEVVKMAMTSDADLFSMIEGGVTEENIEEIIERALRIKKYVVEQDEKESGLRRILNFGHTLGHGVESEGGLKALYHGECVALGMIPMCSASARERLLPVLEKLGLPTVIEGDLTKILQIASHDKKRSGADISVIWVEAIGSCEILKLLLADWEQMIRQNLGVADTEA